MEMDWEEVLQREDIVGGNIETHEDGYIYRGPISSIRLKDGQVYFKSPWTARMPENMSEGWKNWDILSSSVSVDIRPTDIGDGRLKFDMPLLGFGIIIPKGYSQLDPAIVEGLEIP